MLRALSIPTPASFLPLQLSTFHPEMKLAQLGLQLILQKTHALGREGEVGVGIRM